MGTVATVAVTFIMDTFFIFLSYFNFILEYS